METSKTIQEQPNFSTLTEIMTRFVEVPYIQFQRELNEWFAEGLSQKGITNDYFHTTGNDHLPGLLNELISSIYEHAEQQSIQQNGGHPNV